MLKSVYLYPYLSCHSKTFVYRFPFRNQFCEFKSHTIHIIKKEKPEEFIFQLVLGTMHFIKMEL